MHVLYVPYVMRAFRLAPLAHARPDPTVKIVLNAAVKLVCSGILTLFLTEMTYCKATGPNTSRTCPHGAGGVGGSGGHESELGEAEAVHEAMEPALSAKMMPQALRMWRASASVSSLSSMNVPTPLPCHAGSM